MKKAELMNLVGKKVWIYFKDGERGICGTLGYVDEFSEKYDFRKPGYFFINHTSFKVSHVRYVMSEYNGVFIRRKEIDSIPTIIEAEKEE